MVLGAIGVILIAFITMFASGFFLSLALLRKTKLHLFEIIVIGFIFGLFGPSLLTWIESFLITYIHAFSFSMILFELNALLLTFIGILLCIKENAFKDLNLNKIWNNKEGIHTKTFKTKKFDMRLVWTILFAIMIITFASRIVNLGVSPHFFEFDPYFDMMSTQSILVLGHQFLFDHSSWPVMHAGTNHRVEPIVLYFEAYWYTLSNSILYHHPGFSTNLMSYVSSFYPPIAAALLVFSIFLLLYNEYDPYIGLIGAGLTATVPTILQMFIAGEQLLEAFGIFVLFFFLATYLLAIKDMGNKRLAILAGIAFIANFTGAHYFTVTAGVFVVYILIQGIVDFLRNKTNKDFFVMNGIILLIVGIFMIPYSFYQTSLSADLSNILGIPFIFAAPLFTLIFVAFIQYVPKFLKEKNIFFKNEMSFALRLGWLALLLILAVILIFATPLGHSVKNYLNISARFTTPSKPLFMTVAQYEPSGIFFNFGANGFGMLGGTINLSHTTIYGTTTTSIPVVLLLILAISIILIILSIIYRDNKVGILYLAIAIPLAFAGFSEVKYLPHFAIALIILFCVMLGELAMIAEHNFSLRFKEPKFENEEKQQSHNKKMNSIVNLLYALGIFSISSILGIAYLVYVSVKDAKIQKNVYIYTGMGIFLIIIIITLLMGHGLIFGESKTIASSFASYSIYQSNTNANLACNKIANSSYSIGYEMFCNQIPGYWINATNWMQTNAGPTGPRVLAWWDYGDWINWFGHSNAVLRGDNANATEDGAVAASYILAPKDGYTSNTLATMMNTNQTKFVVFDNQLISKWQALDFLGCVYVNQTSESYAKSAAKAANSSLPYVLGTSQCEIQHDPEFLLLPIPALSGQSQSNNLNFYCQIKNSSASSIYVKSIFIIAGSPTNQSACVSVSNTNTTTLQIYNASGSKTNAYIDASQYLGEVSVPIGNANGTQTLVPYAQFLVLYTPNAANGVITNAPTQFYNSNFYKGFILGNLPGFHLVYPLNATGINYLNGTYPIRIYALNNYTGGNPPTIQKPSYINNNYTFP